jgi:hypothetical protein
MLAQAGHCLLLMLVLLLLLGWARLENPVNDGVDTSSNCVDHTAYSIN